MIEVTKINGVKILVNTSLIETVEETPDTVITLTDGKKIIIKESKINKAGIFCENSGYRKLRKHRRIKRKKPLK